MSDFTENFCKKINKKLESLSSNEKKSWNNWTERTRIVVKKDGVVRKVLEQMGYKNPRDNKHDPQESQMIYLPEDLRKDFGVYKTSGNLNFPEAFWGGQYERLAVIEVENNIQEFEMTIRGMADIRAENYIAIFYTDKDETEIRVGNEYYGPIKKKERGTILFKDWTPLWRRDDKGISDSGLSGQKPINATLLVIFISNESPRIVSSKTFAKE